MRHRFTSVLAIALLAAAPAWAAGSATVTLEVSKMDCAACPLTVREALKRVPGVESAQVDYKTKLAVVVFDPAKATTAALTQATADVGYPSRVK